MREWNVFSSWITEAPILGGKVAENSQSHSLTIKAEEYRGLKWKKTQLFTLNRTLNFWGRKCSILTRFTGSMAALGCARVSQSSLISLKHLSIYLCTSHGEAPRHSWLSIHAMLRSTWADCEGIFPAVLLAIFIGICAVTFWQYLAHTVSRVALQFCMV